MAQAYGSHRVEIRIVVFEPCAIHRFGAVQESSAFSASSLSLAAAIADELNSELEFLTVQACGLHTVERHESIPLPLEPSGGS